MGISNVNGTNNNSNTYNAAYGAAASAAASQAAQEIMQGQNQEKDNGSDVAKITLNKTQPSAYEQDINKINEIYSAQKNYMKNMQTMVNQLLEQSGSAMTATFGEGAFNLNMDVNTASKYFNLLVKNNDGSFSFDPTLSNTEKAALQAKAVEDISEDGYFGVKNTSERILSFAKALTGGDPAKAESMRQMFQKGFDEVEAMFDGKLPEISQKTYDAVMKGFDEWIGATAESNQAEDAKASGSST